MDVGVMLAEKIGKEPMVVEVEFERIFGGWLRNGFAKASCRLFAGWRSRKQGSIRPPRCEDRTSFRVHF
jgi:hypothetical protein